MTRRKTKECTFAIASCAIATIVSSQSSAWKSIVPLPHVACAGVALFWQAVICARSKDLNVTRLTPSTNISARYLAGGLRNSNSRNNHNHDLAPTSNRCDPVVAQAHRMTCRRRCAHICCCDDALEYLHTVETRAVCGDQNNWEGKNQITYHWPYLRLHYCIHNRSNHSWTYFVLQQRVLICEIWRYATRGVRIYTIRTFSRARRNRWGCWEPTVQWLYRMFAQCSLFYSYHYLERWPWNSWHMPQWPARLALVPFF